MYHVCHKCGLPRSKASDDVDLGYCGCIGQTWFPYEAQARTEDEARLIAKEHYLQWQELYSRQGREADSYARLEQQYSKVL